jgi:rod shape-determining protein MreD
VKTAFGLVSLVVVALLLRSTALSVLAARGVVLDVLAFVTVLWALKSGEAWGSTFGFVLGLVSDLDAAHWLGRHALALAALGYVVGRLSHSLVRDSVRTQLVILFVVTFLHQTWSLLFELRGPVGIGFLLGRAAVAGAATALAGTVALILVHWGAGQPLFGHADVQSGPAH